MPTIMKPKMMESLGGGRGYEVPTLLKEFICLAFRRFFKDNSLILAAVLLLKNSREKII
ncbi:hypothetical protein L8106_22441 [Lyngbya sp. PCC 8106]|nr:hypothetical protein L8106_22441 [Lyngbya sp. PCC 8106]